MARRIRWQILIAVLSSLLVTGLLGQFALRNTAVANPLAGGRLVEAVVGTPEQTVALFHDPLADPVGRDISALLFDGLTRVGADGLIDLALAEEIQVDAGGEVYTYRLRRDVRWHDGEPFSAADVVFTLRTIQDVQFDGDPTLVATWQDVLVDQVDAYTVRFTLRNPNAGFRARTTVPILPFHLLGNLPPGAIATSDFVRNPVGTGPFALTELTSEVARFRANPDYFGGRPFLDEIELRFIASQEAALALLQRGEVQALGGDRALQAASLPRDLRRAEVPLDQYDILTFNLRESPLANPDFRQALAQGLDRRLLIESALDGYAATLDSPILPGWWAYEPSATWYDYEPQATLDTLADLGYQADASGLLSQAGQPLIFELITDNNPLRLAAAQEIARQWNELGIGIELRSLNSSELIERLRNRDFMLALHGWVNLGVDPDVSNLWHSSRAETGPNYAGLADEEIDKLLSSARSQTELAARSADYAAFQRRWIELAPAIPLYQPLYTFAYDEQLGGIGFADPQSAASLLMLGSADRYRSVERWFVNSAREVPGNLR
jgi:peptide/nickel transport system substrate-binding protein